MKTVIILVAALMLALIIGAVIVQSVLAQTPSVPAAQPADTTAVVPKDSLHYVAYYFYTNVRCATCRKLEAYSQEAVDSGFVKAIAEKRLEFRGVNTDEEANAHFLKDYELFTKSVVLVAYEGDKQVRWKNLGKIWELVGDKPAYLAYVRSELEAFMAGPAK